MTSRRPAGPPQAPPEPWHRESPQEAFQHPGRPDAAHDAELQSWWDPAAAWTADPPPDYGHGLSQWADQGPFAVPPALRDYYARAEVPKQAMRRYLEQGLERTEATQVEHRSGETIWINRLTKYSGRQGWPVLMHAERTQIAVRGWRAARGRVVPPACAGCGRPGSWTSPVPCCADCAPLLEDLRRRVLLERRAAALHADGVRTVGEALGQALANLEAAPR